MAEDDQTADREESGDSAGNPFPSHDPLPLPPAVSFERPVIGRRKTSPTGEKDASPESAGSSGRAWGSGMAAAFSLGGCILAGFWLGSQADAHWNHGGSTPWGTIVGVLLGAFVGFYNLIRLVSRK